MAEAKITLESGPLNTATAALERIAALYTRIGGAQQDLGRQAEQHRQRHANAGGGHGGNGHGGGHDGAAGFAHHLIKQVEGVGAGAVGEMANGALEVIAPLLEELGPIGIAIGALTAAFAALEFVTKGAAEALASFATSAMQMGSTGMQAAELGAMGVSPQEAAAFRARQGSDPFAIMEAGFQMDPRFGGNQNTGAGILEQLERLHRMGPGDAQLLAARRMGLEGHLGDVNVSNDVWEQRTQVGEQRAALLGSGQAAIDLTARYKILEEQMETLGMAVATQFMPPLNAFLGWVLNAGNVVQGILNPGEAGKGGGKHPHEKLSDSMDKATDALGDLRSTMERGMSVTGGGAQGAHIPTHLKGDERYRAMRNNAYRMGAIF